MQRLTITFDTKKVMTNVGHFQTKQLLYKELRGNENNLWLKLDILEGNSISDPHYLIEDKNGYMIPDLKRYHQLFCKYLGPQFNKRFAKATYKYWFGPLKDKGFDKYIYQFNVYKTRLDNKQLRRLWKKITLVDQLKADGLDHLAPLVIYFGRSPQELKSLLGKGTWKYLANRSMTANKNIVQILDYYETHFRLFGSNNRIRALDKKHIISLKPLMQRLSTVKSITLKYFNFYKSYFSNEEDTNLLVIQQTIGVLNQVKGATAEDAHSNMIEIRDTIMMLKDEGRKFNDHWSLKRVRSEHDKAVSRLNLKAYPNGDKTIYGFENYKETFSVDHVRIQVLKTPINVFTEGAIMKHCISSYMNYMEAKTYLAISLQDEVTGERSTLGLNILDNGLYQLDQHKGKFNRKISSNTLQEVAKLISNTDLSIIRDAQPI